MRRLTVLGAAGGYPTAGQACSGFLLEWDGFHLVLDLGYGTLARLLAHRPSAEVDAVVITHEHPDHCIDLHGLFRIRHYGAGNLPALPVYCPPGMLDRLRGVEPDVDLRSVFDVHELPGRHQVGPFVVTGMLLPHHVPNAGIRLDAGTRALAYTGDTGPTPLLAELGRDTELYIVDATDRPGELGRTPRSLLTAGEAGYWAARAGARRLLLTHLWPGTDRVAAVAAARASFSGEVLVAEEGLEILLET